MTKPDNNYECGHCGYEGPCYGIPIFGPKASVSAPFCKRCQMNNKLTKKMVSNDQA